MSPTRRELIGAASLIAGGLLAGCLGGVTGRPPTESQSPTGTPDPTESTSPEPLPGGGEGEGETRPASTGGPGVTLTSVDGLSDLPVEPGVEVLEPVATEDHPPSLRVTLSNTGEGALTVGEGRAIRFQYVSDDSGTLQLLPAEGEYPVPEGNCWRLTEGVATTMEYRTDELEPGEALEADVELYALPGYDGCLPVGEFRFETAYTVSTGDPDADAEDAERATWGFSVSLE